MAVVVRWVGRRDGAVGGGAHVLTSCQPVIHAIIKTSTPASVTVVITIISSTTTTTITTATMCVPPCAFVPPQIDSVPCPSPALNSYLVYCVPCCPPVLPLFMLMHCQLYLQHLSTLSLWLPFPRPPDCTRWPLWSSNVSHADPVLPFSALSFFLALNCAVLPFSWPCTALHCTASQVAWDCTVLPLETPHPVPYRLSRLTTRSTTPSHLRGSNRSCCAARASWTTARGCCCSPTRRGRTGR